MLTREVIIQLYPHSIKLVDLYLSLLQVMARQHLINTPSRLAAFLSQAGHESAGFSVMIENLNYSADGLAATWGARFARKDSAGHYITSRDGDRVRRMPNDEAIKLHRCPEAIANRVYSGRLGNGSETSGEGWLYRGRGLIQITGKTNYRQCSLGLYKDERLLVAPQLLEQWPGAVASAGWYWSSRNLNTLADGNEFEAVTRAVNGGLNGHAQRLALYERALSLLS